MLLKRRRAPPEGKTHAYIGSMPRMRSVGSAYQYSVKISSLGAIAQAKSEHVRTSMVAK